MKGVVLVMVFPCGRQPTVTMEMPGEEGHPDREDKKKKPTGVGRGEYKLGSGSCLVSI